MSAPRARRRRPSFVLVTTPIVLAALIGLWKGYVEVFHVSRFILPPPEDVWSAFVQLVQEGNTWHHARITAYEIAVGFGLAVAVGILLGLVLGKLQKVEQVASPFLVALQTTPKVALIPLFLLWFGFGTSPKILTGAIFAFFPITTNTIAGVRAVDRGHRDVMESLNAGRLQTFRLLDLPSALPYVLAGMEIGIVLATVGAVVAEYLGGRQGLGYLAVVSLNQFRVERLFAIVFVLAAMGFAFQRVVVELRRVLIPWHESAAQTGRAWPAGRVDAGEPDNLTAVP